MCWAALSGNAAEQAVSFRCCLVSAGYCSRVYGVFLFVPTFRLGNFNLFKKSVMKMLVDIDLRDNLSMESLAIDCFSITLVLYYLLVTWIFSIVLIA